MTTSPCPAAVRVAQGPERSPRRDLVHLAILVVPWALFGWLWWRVAATTSGEQLIHAFGLVVLVAAISLPATALWVLHNVRIFRRKGPRTGAAAPAFAYHVDWTSRPVVADWDAVRAAKTVVVSVAAHQKRFLSDESTELDQLLEADDPREPAAAGTGR